MVASGPRRFSSARLAIGFRVDRLRAQDRADRPAGRAAAALLGAARLLKNPPFSAIFSARSSFHVCLFRFARHFAVRACLFSSEERRVGKEFFSTFRSRWSPYH